jgi:hypothetical protein
MSVKQSGSNWAVFGQAAWEMAVDLEKGHKLAVHVAMFPTARRGVFVWAAAAQGDGMKGAASEICRVQAEFPNSRAETLEAFLYSLMVKLAHCVEAKAASEAVDRAKAGR